MGDQIVRGAGFRSLWFQALLLAILLVVALSIYQLALWKQRPMFRNTFARHPKIGIVYAWIPEYPHTDKVGNMAIADYKLNLLVIFLAGDTPLKRARFLYPRVVDHGVRFPAIQDEDELDFFVPSTMNTLIVFRGDGSRRQFPLVSGEAERIHKLLDDCPGDFRPFLTKLYAEKHTGTLDVQGP